MDMQCLLWSVIFVSFEVVDWRTHSHFTNSFWWSDWDQPVCSGSPHSGMCSEGILNLNWFLLTWRSSSRGNTFHTADAAPICLSISFSNLLHLGQDPYLDPKKVLYPSLALNHGLELEALVLIPVASHSSTNHFREHNPMKLIGHIVCKNQTWFLGHRKRSSQHLSCAQKFCP